MQKLCKNKADKLFFTGFVGHFLIECSSYICSEKCQHLRVREAFKQKAEVSEQNVIEACDSELT